MHQQSKVGLCQTCLPFGKIIKKAVFTQLNGFMAQNNYFDVFLSGFKSDHRAELYLYEQVIV